ncbi:hypothetical protein INR49_022649 [Caranx melampygus]|nr:hypothetical protein INR49_022649 [Caranx melampygus]
MSRGREAVLPCYPGQIHANIGPVKTNVTFDHRDCGVTLLKNDHVLINLLVDMVTRKRRAANIKPKIPFTFSYTKEKRELGVITFLGAEEGIWTPLGFKVRDPCTMDDISKERFEGTVLRAISKYPRKEIKKEPPEDEAPLSQVRDHSVLQEEPVTSSGFGHAKIKVEKKDEDEEEAGKPDGAGGGGVKIKKEVEEEKEVKETPSETKPDPEMGRLVMTINGQQKQLSFDRCDLLTGATMLDGDKVRFNIATHRETKEERATYVEILPDSFEESTEQRRHGIVIEFSENSGLIKCTQKPQLFFSMSEVIEKKKLELNEKVEFSVVPHETAEGGNQAIRIKRYTESVFLPVRKLVGVGANKGKDKPETDKLKVVVKNLRAQDSKSGISRRDYSATRRRYGHSRSRSRSRSRGRSRSKSRSRSPSRDQFGRIIKRRRSSSTDRDRKSSRHKHSRERSHRRSRSRSKSRSRSRSRSKSTSRSRSRSRERSKDRAGRKRSKISMDREDSHKRRRDVSPSPGVV